MEYLEFYEKMTIYFEFLEDDVYKKYKEDIDQLIFEYWEIYDKSKVFHTNEWGEREILSSLPVNTIGKLIGITISIIKNL